MTQGYNIYRYSNKNNAQRRLSQHQFKYGIIQGLLNHIVVTEPAQPDNNAQSVHEIAQWPVGSRGDGVMRKYRSVCRFCPAILPDGSKNFNISTSFYCKYCKVGLHPDCFTKYHQDKPDTFSPKKRLNVAHL